jgi:hypothetical protein
MALTTAQIKQKVQDWVRGITVAKGILKDRVSEILDNLADRSHDQNTDIGTSNRDYSINIKPDYKAGTTSLWFVDAAGKMGIVSKYDSIPVLNLQLGNPDIGYRMYEYPFELGKTYIVAINGGNEADLIRVAIGVDPKDIYPYTETEFYIDPILETKDYTRFGLLGYGENADLIVPVFIREKGKSDIPREFGWSDDGGATIYPFPKTVSQPVNPEGVKWTIRPTVKIVDQNVTVSEGQIEITNADGTITTKDIPASTLTITAATAGYKRGDMIKVDYTADILVYSITEGTENISAYVYPTLQAGQLFVTYLDVAGAVVSNNTYVKTVNKKAPDADTGDVTLTAGDVGAYSKAEAQKHITQATTAPASPAVDDLWLDISVSPALLKRYNGVEWVDTSLPPNGTAADYFAGDRTWKSFFSGVRSATMSVLNYVNQEIAISDTLEVMFGKLQGQINEQAQSSNVKVDVLQAQFTLSGGGTITVDASYNLKWSARFIPVPVDMSLGSSGFFDFVMPASGTVITGVNGATDVTVSTSGILLPVWHALYAEVTVGSANTGYTYKVSNYTTNVVIPENWILIGVRNGDSNTYKLGTGQIIGISQTITNGLYGIGSIAGLQTELNNKAPLVSPALTGTPTAPTPAESTNTTQIATTAFVQGVAAKKVDEVSTLDIDSVPATEKTKLEDTLNWDAAGAYIGPAIVSTYSGQRHYNASYKFEAMADNLWIRIKRS